MSAPAKALHVETGAPVAAPSYRIDRSFEWNTIHGPAFAGPWPEIPGTPMKDFLGLPVRSRFGIPASILFNRRWIETYARLGFDILTYKTVRSVPMQCLPEPNWKFANPVGLDRLGDPDAPQRPLPSCVVEADTRRAAAATGLGSFGMPSSAPAFWSEDIARCRSLLGPGQVLVVSIVATVGAGKSEADILDDFRDLAARVREAGAMAVEANLSCPNVQRREGEVYLDPDLSGRVARAVRDGAGTLPVLLKTGHIRNDETLRAFLRAVAGSANAVTMINGLNRPVIDDEGNPAFGPGRERAGIIGGELHGLALEMVGRAAGIIRRERLGLEIVGVGGVAGSEQVRAFIEAGACAALSASAATWNPLLAAEIKTAAPDL